MSSFSRKTTLLNSIWIILSRTRKEDEEISSYRLTTGMAATTGRSERLQD